ncbi:MAG: hypothetical protein C0621_03010 [Desulfuromonas sp.]|nr:MAG: hypothetical protein C0621_03010 [Desulfuromonas sp.]
MKNLGISILAILLLTPSLLWAKEVIDLTSKVEIEVVTTNEQGEQVTVRQPASKVLPGETLIYTNTYHNVGDDLAQNIVVNNAVPAHTSYIAGSAFGDGCEILLSADGGKSYASEGELTVVGDDGTSRPALPEEITHLRWIVREYQKPGDGGDVGFRVRLQ